MVLSVPHNIILQCVMKHYLTRVFAGLHACVGALPAITASLSETCLLCNIFCVRIRKRKLFKTLTSKRKIKYCVMCKAVFSWSHTAQHSLLQKAVQVFITALFEPRCLHNFIKKSYLFTLTRCCFSMVLQMHPCFYFFLSFLNWLHHLPLTETKDV